MQWHRRHSRNVGQPLAIMQTAKCCYPTPPDLYYLAVPPSLASQEQPQGRTTDNHEIPGKERDRKAPTSPPKTSLPSTRGRHRCRLTLQKNTQVKTSSSNINAWQLNYDRSDYGPHSIHSDRHGAGVLWQASTAIIYCAPILSVVSVNRMEQQVLGRPRSCGEMAVTRACRLGSWSDNETPRRSIERGAPLEVQSILQLCRF